MAEGLSGVLPVELLSMFTTSEVEAIVCGVPVIDIKILQAATEYDGVSPDDPHIQVGQALLIPGRYFLSEVVGSLPGQAFWEVVSEMDVEDRRDFINFCSGRSRLPASAADFPMSFRLTAPQPRADDHPDDYLPAAQTCFFSLSLPR
jgi:E3 ubiquitin-protein ligase HERC2